MSQHLFTAIRTAEPIQQELVKVQNHFHKRIPLKQWTYEKDLHITLTFLGATEEDTIGLLKESLQFEAARHHAFELQMNKLGSFGNPRTPRVFWAGIEEDEGLKRLQEGVFQRCKELGFSLENRPYRPHITLGKRWTGKKPLDGVLFGEIEQQKLTAHWYVDEFVLYAIHPNRKQKYEVIQSFPLQRV